MGCYTYISDHEIERYKVVNDFVVNHVLQEVRKIWPVWFVSEREEQYRTHIFGKIRTRTTYTLYQSTGVDEYRVQVSVRTRSELLNFLYGLNTGLNKDKFNELI